MSAYGATAGHSSRACQRQAPQQQQQQVAARRQHVRAGAGAATRGSLHLSNKQQRVRQHASRAQQRRSGCSIVALAVVSEALVAQAPQQSALATKQQTLLYRFIVPEYVTRFGENLKVVGSLPELGAWDLGAAPLMGWREGHRWVHEARLPKCNFEFKVVALLGHEVRWEQGVNRVVQAEDEGVDVPVEVVINLTCSFGLTKATGMELVLNRNSIQESYELAAATLELLRKRRARLEKTLHESSTAAAAAAQEQAAREQKRLEVARLEAAVSTQAQSLEDLGELVSGARLSEDGQSLLLTLTDGKVQVPRQMGSLSHAHHASTIGLALVGDTSTATTGATTTATATITNATASPKASNNNGNGSSSANAAPASANGSAAAATAVPGPAAANGNGKGSSANGSGSLAGGLAAARARVARRQAGLPSRHTDTADEEVLAAALLDAGLDAIAAGGPPSSSDSELELEPDDAAAAMAAAAFASLSQQQGGRGGKRRSGGSSKAAKVAAAAARATEQQAKTAAAVAAATAPVSTTTTGAAAATNAAQAEAASEHAAPTTTAAAAPAPADIAAPVAKVAAPPPPPAPSATSLFFGVDLSSLPPPQVKAGGALYFSAELLAAFDLPKAVPSPSPSSPAAAAQDSASSANGSSRGGEGGVNGGGCDAEIARRLSELGRSLEATLDRVSRRSDAQQPAGAWKEVEAQLHEAQVLQEQLMAYRGGLTAAQRDELEQLQGLVRLATSTLAGRPSVTMTVSRADGQPQPQPASTAV